MTKKKLWEHEERVVIRTEEEYKYMNSFYDKVIEINKYEDGGFLPDFDADILPCLAYVRMEESSFRWGWVGNAVYYVDGEEMPVSEFKEKYGDWSDDEEVVESDTPTNVGNPKYDKTVTGKYGTGSCTVDVYRVLEAFSVVNPQLQHLVKKALNVGQRGHKGEREDLVDILNSAQSALDMFDDLT